MNILVVEDDVAVNQLLCRRLEKEGYQTTSIVSARELLNAVEMGVKADLMLLDYNLNDMDAVQIINRLKNLDRLIPFVICTGVGSESIAVNMMKEGARDYLVKDKSFLDVLLPTVKKVVRELKIERELESAQQKLTYQNAILSAVHELSLDGVLVVDGQDKVVSMNSRLSEMWNIEGFEPGAEALLLFEQVSTQVSNRGSFLTSVSNVNAIVEPKAAKLQDLELKNGCFYELYSTPMKTAEMKYFGRVWYFRDITITHKAQTVLEDARQEAENAARAKAEFLANFSHEVRTPLNSLSGFVELLKTSDLNETQADFLEAVVMSCENLSELINKTLDLSKLEAGALGLEMQLFDIGSTMAEAALLVESVHKKNVKLIVQEADLPPVTGDCLRLKQVFINLLSNALKFTDVGQVEFSCSVQQSGAYRFVVKDSGTGIDPRQQKEIFKEFSQANPSVARERGGTGLGLSISARIVRLMGSELKVVSELGKGSEFFFEVFLKPVENC